MWSCLLGDFLYHGQQISLIVLNFLSLCKNFEGKNILFVKMLLSIVCCQASLYPDEQRFDFISRLNKIV